MRKRILTAEARGPMKADSNWIDVGRLAQAEITSEDAEFPIESALIPGMGNGWRAADAGKQTIRLVFDEPQKIRKIHLQFREPSGGERMQEFVLSWIPIGGQPAREIVRQQYNFSPPHAIAEVEDYAVNLDGVSALELAIVPDKNGGNVRASLEQLRLA